MWLEEADGFKLRSWWTRRRRVKHLVRRELNERPRLLDRALQPPVYFASFKQH